MPKDHHKYAGLMQRFWALFLDFIIFCAVFFPITRIIKGTWLMTPADHQWSYGYFITDPLCLIFLAVMILYFILLEGLAGATFGKMIVGIRVICPDGAKPGIRRAFIRNLLRVIDSLPAFNVLGVYLIVSSTEKARFGDRIARTRVVVKKMPSGKNT